MMMLLRGQLWLDQFNRYVLVIGFRATEGERVQTLMKYGLRWRRDDDFIQLPAVGANEKAQF